MAYPDINAGGSGSTPCPQRGREALRNLRQKDQVSRAAEALVRVLCETLIYVSSRELSNGHFTEDNHKQLSGVGLAVPVYEAKMTRDTRLVVRVTALIRALALQRLSVSHTLRSGLRVECMYYLSYIYTRIS